MKSRNNSRSLRDPGLDRRLSEQAILRQAFRKKDARIRRLERELLHLRDTLRCVLGM